MQPSTLQNQPALASTNPVQNVTTQGFSGSQGTVQYNPNTGAKLAPGEKVVVNPGNSTYGSTPFQNQSTTTLSSDKTKDIMTNNNTLNTISNKGITTTMDASGTPVSTTADGSLYTPPTTTDTSTEDAGIEKLYGEMKANTDAVTAASIASIQQRYSTLKAEQKKANESTLGATRNALLTSGAAQHDVYSDDAINARMTQNAQAISDLEAEENDLINTAKAAQAANNNRILESKLEQINKVRDAKIKATEKANADLVEMTQKAREANMQVEKDTAVADLYSQGITDVSTMLQYLNKSGGNFTAKEVSDTLKNIVPPGLDDLVKTLRTNGAPQDVIQRVLSSTDINSAYKNAGSYAAGGTGIIGEYNLYKAQAESKGQMPVDFNTYQNMDANRKISIAKAGVAMGVSGLTYTPAQEKVIKGVDTAVSKSPAYTRTASMQTYKNNVESALGQGTGVGDIAAINQFQKVIDEGAVTRDQDVVLIQKSQSLANTLKTKIKKLQKGEQLSPELRQQMLKAVTDIYTSQQKAVEKDPFIKSKKKELERNHIDPTDTIFGELSSFAEDNMGANLIQTEDQAKTKILNYGKTNPAFQPIIMKKVSETNPFTGQKYTYQDLLQIYPEIK